MPRTSKNPKKVVKPIKSAKQQLEEKKLKYKENQDLRKYNLKMQELENIRLQNESQEYIQEKEIQRKQISDKYKHDERMAELRVKDHELFTQFITKEQELYIDFIKTIIGPLSEAYQQKIDSLKEIRQETIVLLENRIKSIDEELNKLNDEKSKAYEEGNYPAYSQKDKLIKEMKKSLDLKETELKDFIEISWNDLLHLNFELPSPQEFVNTTESLGMISENNQSYLENN